MGSFTRRVIEFLRRLWGAANHAKAAWQWWALLAPALGLPGIAVVFGVVNEQPLDVILLYVMAGIAFGVVILNEGRLLLDSLAKRARRGLRLVFDPSCCGVSVSRPKNEAEYRVKLGVYNTGSTTIERVSVYVKFERFGFLDGGALRWEGLVPDQALTIHPSPTGFHHHVDFVTRTEGGALQIQFAHDPWFVMAQELRGDILVTGHDVMPTTVRVELTRSTKPPLVVKLYP